MPNHVSTKLEVTGNKEQLKKFRETHFKTVEEKDFDGNPTMVDVFDFDTIIPMPPSLNITSGTSVSNAIALIKAEQGDYSHIEAMTDYSWVREKCPEGMNKVTFIMNDLKESLTEEEHAEGLQAIENIEKYGHQDWYSWKIQNWGTKWGAYHLHIQDVTDDIFICEYDTAWSPATPIFDRLHEMYPQLRFEQKVLDEGMGFGGTQLWDEDGWFSEDFCSGDDLYHFCNEEFGCTYQKCELCKEWYDPQCSGDETVCEDCIDEKVS
jgi:hypothetical protein